MKKIITIIFIIVFTLEFNAQHFTHDIGISVGKTSLQSDYGERQNFKSTIGNNNFSFAIAHYLHFFNRTRRWDPNNVLHNHLMVKSELKYVNNIEMKHHGYWASKQSDASEQLRAMKGGLSMLNIGADIEYFFKPLEEFIYPYSDIFFNPFFSLGFRYVFYNNTLNSDMGNWKQNLSVLPLKYQNLEYLKIGSGETFAFNFGLGTRIKFSKDIDFLAQLNYLYFFSDEVDGLKTDRIENKNNEWAFNMQFGFIYHLNFSAPLF